MTLFPPIYPLILTLSGIIKSNLIHSARWLHALLFGINTILFGIIIFISTRRNHIALFLGLLLIVSSTSFLKIHAYAWSESPFLTFSFSSFIFLFLYIVTNQSKYLFLSSATLGLAIATRYAGFSLLLPEIIVLFLFVDQSFYKKIKNIFIFVGISITPILFWMLRNFLITNSATDRSFIFHPININSITKSFFSNPLFYHSNPVSYWVNGFVFFVIILIIGDIFLGIIQETNYQMNPSPANWFFLIIGTLSFISLLPLRNNFNFIFRCQYTFRSKIIIACVFIFDYRNILCNLQ